LPAGRLEHGLYLIASLNAEAVVIVSAFALIVRNRCWDVFAQEGISPHRVSTISRSPISRMMPITGWKVCGATGG
jgi:hypothetical protein